MSQLHQEISDKIISTQNWLKIYKYIAV